MRVYSDADVPYELGDEIGMGREGAVYTVAGLGGLVKIYHDPTPLVAEKVEAMTGACYKMLQVKRALLGHVVWPARALYKFPHKHGFAGFLMPRAPQGAVALTPFNQYPTPEGVPVVGSRARIEMAIELCHLMDELHGIGIVMGDLNPANILIDGASVYLIDVDSYGFTLGGKRFDPACAARGFVAPEVLQRMEDLGVHDFGALALAAGEAVFTPKTDAFALAVHIFELLNFGRHPFEGLVDLSTLEPDEIPAPPSLNANIRQGKSPYLGNLAGYLVPDWALRLEDFPTYLRQAFERSLFGGSEERLTPKQWAALLEFYLSETVECALGHRYHALAPECPYCRGDGVALARLGQAKCMLACPGSDCFIS